MASHPLILIVEKHDGLRDELRRRLAKTFPKFRFAEAMDGESAISLALRKKPDLVLMDIILQNVGGIEVIRRIRKDQPDTKIIVLSLHEELPFRKSAAEAGAVAYLGKSAPFEDILAAVRSALGDG